MYISGKWYIYVLETYLFEGYSKQITYSVIYNGEPHTHTCIVCGAIYIYTCEIVYIYIYTHIYIYIFRGHIYKYIYVYVLLQPPTRLYGYGARCILENSIYMLKTYIRDI